MVDEKMMPDGKLTMTDEELTNTVGKGWPGKVDNTYDNVNHPQHYGNDVYETIKILKNKLTPEQLEGFCIGNSLKYLTRYRHKNGLEDLKKAQWYLNFIIKEMEDNK